MKILFTEKQIDNIKHMLGLCRHNKINKPYRNYYNAGHAEMESFELLVKYGYATRSYTPKDCGGIYYHLTEKCFEKILTDPRKYGLDARIKKLGTFLYILNR